MKASTKLWYLNPAANWDEALPVGNGRMGAMVFGGVEKEKIQLNEDSIWSGTKRNRNNPSAYENLERIRQLIRDEKFDEAEKLSKMAMAGTPDQQRHYQPLGELTIEQQLPGAAEDYKRSLDLNTAVSLTEFTAGGVKFKREVIASFPDQCICVHFTADRKGGITFLCDIDGRDDNFDKNIQYNGNTILYEGCTGSADGVLFSCAISAVSAGGTLKTIGNKIHAKDCDEVFLVICARTNFYTSDYRNLALNDVRRVLRKGYDAVRNGHIWDYQSLYSRCDLSICDNNERASALPTDQRLQSLKENHLERDNKLTELYWNFAKYLMISGSRPGTQPLNLQGIWNKDMWPAWGSKYTININTQMNYWGAETINLPECHSPLFDLIERMRENGRETARKMYGCKGFVAHHNTDIWGDTAPQDSWPPATIWPMGAAWLCLHIWEHYLFTMDTEFLRDKYDTLKESAEFFEEYLIENTLGELVTCPSVSPENVFITKSGAQGTMCMGPTMDTQIIRELFNAVIRACDILGVDSQFAQSLKSLEARLPRNKVGKYGQVMEWAEDYDEAEPGHRHISQLFGLYPASQITPRHTPDLAEASRATIQRRLFHGGGHTGWSRAWIINYWARLLDAELVYDNIQRLLSQSTNNNMLDSHPPFQIDGNFGGAAGITEAILQSHNDEICFLPALPSEWRSGSAWGIIARGGFSVDIIWENNALKAASITSKAGQTCKVYSEVPLEISNAQYSIFENVYTFSTKAGETYKISVMK